MSNKKFYFEFKKKKEIPKIYDLFPSRSKNELLLISKIYHFYLFEKIKKKIFLNYNRCRLLTFTKKIEKSLSTRMSACSESSYIYIYIYLRGFHSFNKIFI